MLDVPSCGFVSFVVQSTSNGGKWRNNVLLRFYRFDHHELAHGALIHELDAASDLGEEGVVFAAADVESGLYAGAALADDDRAAGDDLSAERLKAEPLRIRVAAVS